jgi:putative peptidoglycan lipid II flippase
MSMSAAELPAMSSATGSDEEIREYVRSRLAGGLRRIAFFIIPSVIAFIAFGDVIAGAVYQSGRFTASDADYVWGIVAASSVGLLASTLGRLYSSAYYALRDTDTPLRYAVIRVVLSTVFGYLSAVILPPLLGIDARWGVAGLTFASGVVGWLEYLLLRSTLGKRIGETRLPAPFLGTLWGSAAVGAGVGWAIKIAVSSLHPLLVAVAVLLPFGVIYFGLTAWWQVPESREVLQKILGRVRRAGRGG